MDANSFDVGLTPNRRSAAGDYVTRTPEDYLSMLTPDVSASLSPAQLSEIRMMLLAAIPKPSPKLVDLRFGIDLLVSRFYIVLFVGQDRRKERRRYLPTGVTRVGNAIAATLLLISINVFISLIIFLFAYLVKSAVGIDLFHGSHLADQLQKF